MNSSNSLREYIRYMPSQGNVACCTSNSVLLAFEIMAAIKGLKITTSRLFLYYMTRLHADTLFSKGARLADTLDAFVKYGVAPEESWPFTDRRVNMIPHTQSMQLAVYNRISSYRSINLFEYKEYIDSGKPIIIGLITGCKFWSLFGDMSTHRYEPINGTSNIISRGHALTIVGYDNNLNGGSWIVANSLGTNWGDQGFSAIPYDCSIDIGEAYILDDIIITTP